MADSLNKLVLAAGSLERCHSLEFPAITLPQIGSNDAMTVSEKQTVDFDVIIDEMPSVLVVGARLVNSAFLYWGVIVFIKRTLEGVFET